MTDHLSLIESTLMAMPESGDLRRPLFDRFFGAFPQRRAIFYNEDAATRRMAEETLQMLYGLAGGENWVWPHIATLVDQHRNYGLFPVEEYHRFVDMVIETVADAAGAAWNAEAEAAWRTQAEALKSMISQAHAI